jgi:hypothetical protein
MLLAEHTLLLAHTSTISKETLSQLELSAQVIWLFGVVAAIHSQAASAVPDH